MKKWLTVLLVGIILSVASVYIFVPDVISIRSSTVIKATRPGLHRMLLDKANVAKWWPGKINHGSFYLNDRNYKISDNNVTILPVSISTKNDNLNTSIFLISFPGDSTKLGWVGSMRSSYNPFKRFLAYLEAKKIKNDMKTLLQKMEGFYSKPENIYGLEIKKDLIVDGILIGYIDKRKDYPNTEFIYGLLDKLKTYAKKNGAKENGYPMLNIRSVDSVNFGYIVGLPIDKALPSSGDILQKRLPGRCHMLVTEVKGGIGITTAAFKQMQYYLEDYQRKAPALPFYSLVTDRAKEPDTSKWVTKIYFPVF